MEVKRFQLGHPPLPHWWGFGFPLASARRGKGSGQTQRGQSQRDCVYQPRVSEPWVSEFPPESSTLKGLRTDSVFAPLVRNPYRVGSGRGGDLPRVGKPWAERRNPFRIHLAPMGSGSRVTSEADAHYQNDSVGAFGGAPMGGQEAQLQRRKAVGTRLCDLDGWIRGEADSQVPPPSRDHLDGKDDGLF